MASEKRKQLRMDMLDELYQFHLSERGKKALIPGNLEDRDPEKYFALEYLADKGLIRFKAENGQLVAKITQFGINLVKNIKLGNPFSTA
jgi:predicted transcriptional regulator